MRERDSVGGKGNAVGRIDRCKPERPPLELQ